jgi:hypothetical protein
VSLDGISIGGFANTPYEFDAGQTLLPGERIVVARNPAVFQSIYGSNIRLALSGYSDRSLDNGGESINLAGPQGQILQNFSYDDSGQWPSAPDGSGRSLEIVDPLASASAPSNWRASLYFLGSPGSAGLPIAGDYDASGTVDAADQGAWKTSFGSTLQPAGFGADGNRDGRIDAADFTVWRDNLGSTTTLYGAGGSGAASAFVAQLSTSSEDSIADSPSLTAIAPVFYQRPPVRIDSAVGRQIVSASVQSFNELPHDDLLLSVLYADHAHEDFAVDDESPWEAIDDPSPEALCTAVDRVFELLE